MNNRLIALQHLFCDAKSMPMLDALFHGLQPQPTVHLEAAAGEKIVLENE